MEVMKNVEYKEGKIIIDIGGSVERKIQAFRAKVESGEVDYVKGTDLDKSALLKAIDLILAGI